MPDVEMILLHGWALDASIWRCWSEVAAKMGCNVRIQMPERGYFTDSSFPSSFSPETGETDTNRILVVHSLALHLASEQLLKEAHLLVIIGGFAHFHDGPERHSKLSRIAVRKMLHKLDNAPAQVLKDFYDNCGFSTEFAQSHIDSIKNSQLVKADLELLNDSSVSPASLLMPEQVLILHGRNDAIAAVHHAEQLRQMRSDSQVRVHESATHALPHDHAEWCLQQVQDCLMVPC